MDEDEYCCLIFDFDVDVDGGENPQKNGDNDSVDFFKLQSEFTIIINNLL